MRRTVFNASIFLRQIIQQKQCPAEHSKKYSGIIPLSKSPLNNISKWQFHKCRQIVVLFFECQKDPLVLHDAKNGRDIV
jgi:hypothetical protein